MQLDKDVDVPSLLPFDQKELERRKLGAEIQLLRLQSRSERRKLDREKRAEKRVDWKIWIPIGVSLVTLILTVVPVALQLSGYISQQRREYELRLSQELLQLVQDISDPSKQDRRDTYIYLLSAFEEDAIPVLLDQLHHATAEDRESILRSLAAIQSKKSVPEGLVTRRLVGESKSAFDSYHSNLRGAANFVVALGRLAAEERPTARRLLMELRRQVEKDPETSMHPGILIPLIEEACQSLTGTDCPPQES